MASKFGEINITNIELGLQILNRAPNFDSKIVSAFSTDTNKFNQPARLGTFDSIHDFKTFGTNPIDTIEYQRKDSQYNINKCFFNFNRIMCRGGAPISVENSFLTKPRGQNPGQGAYDNKPLPITSVANVEDYFCLLNLYNRVSNDDLRIIKGTPKTKIPDQNTDINFKAITEFIVKKGWADVDGSNAYINTITDVSPAFRKYYIRSETVNNVEIQNLNVKYRAIISQETANDPAGSLSKSILISAFGRQNVLIEKPGQSRTYISETIDSFFEPTLSGIRQLDNTGNNLNFNTTLTLVDKSTTPLGDISLDIPYAKSGNTPNPNERPVINKDINKVFHGKTKKVLPAELELSGRDDADHTQANAFYNNDDVASFSNAEVQKTIARHFTRKRLGDVLQASVCRLINSDYTDGDDNRIKFNSLEKLSSAEPITSDVEVVPKSAIFIGEDRMIIAYCLINQIPCIYDNKNYTIVYMPQRPTDPTGNKYTNFATIPATVTPAQSNIPIPITTTLGGGSSLKQSGGGGFNNIYEETIRNEPYYFYKYLLLHSDTSNDLKLIIEEINKNIIAGIYTDNVFSFDGIDDTKQTIMYFVSPQSQTQIESSVTPNDNPMMKAQQIVDIPNKPTFINIFSDYPKSLDANTLLSVTVEDNGARTVYYPSTKGDQRVIEVVDMNELKSYFGDTPSVEGVMNQTLYNENVQTLKTYLSALNKYEVYSIVDESNDADFYDINESGIRVAYDCFFYVFINNLVEEFQGNAKTVSYKLLFYLLFKERPDFVEIIKYDPSVSLDSSKETTQSLNKTTQVYFNDLFERSTHTAEELNLKMHNFFMLKEYVNQYECAIVNKFTYYGFTTIKHDFEVIINGRGPMNIVEHGSPYRTDEPPTPGSPIRLDNYETPPPKKPRLDTVINVVHENETQPENYLQQKVGFGGKKTRKHKKISKHKKTINKKKTRKCKKTRKHKKKRKCKKTRKH